MTRKKTNAKHGNEGSMLSGLLIQILSDLGISSKITVGRLFDRYILREKKNNNRIRKDNSRKVPVLNKNHVINKVYDPNLTWKTFLLTIFKILNVRKMTLKIELEHHTGKITTHDYKITNDKVEDDDR